MADVIGKHGLAHSGEKCARCARDLERLAAYRERMATAAQEALREFSGPRPRPRRPARGQFRPGTRSTRMRAENRRRQIHRRLRRITRSLRPVIAAADPEPTSIRKRVRKLVGAK